MSDDKHNSPRPPANRPQPTPNPAGDRPAPESPNEPLSNADTADPHPDSEEGYDRKTKIPTTGL